MLLGEFIQTIDDKGRVTIPATFRAELEAGLVVTRGLDRCLAIYPAAEWKRLAAEVSALPTGGRRGRALRRVVFAQAYDAAADSQGRVLIPPRLREYADFEGEVVVIGLTSYIEVWDPEAWRAECQLVEGDNGAIEEWAALTSRAARPSSQSE